MRSRTLLTVWFVLVAISKCSPSLFAENTDRFSLSGQFGVIYETIGGLEVPTAEFQWGVFGGISNATISGNGDRSPSANLTVSDTVPPSFPPRLLYDVVFAAHAMANPANAITGFSIQGGGETSDSFDVLVTVTLDDGPHFIDMHYALFGLQLGGLAGISALGGSNTGALDISVALFAVPDPSIVSGAPFFSITMTSVPEPSSLTMALCGSMALLICHRRWRRLRTA